MLEERVKEVVCLSRCDRYENDSMGGASTLYRWTCFSLISSRSSRNGASRCD